MADTTKPQAPTPPKPTAAPAPAGGPKPTASPAPAPAGTPAPVAVPASGPGPTVHVATADLSFGALLARAAKHPSPGQATTTLRLLRMWRVLAWGPRGGGKTTAILSMAKSLGRCAVVSLDKDMQPRPNVEHFPMPSPEVEMDIPLLSRAHADVMETIRKLRGTPAEYRMVVLDTMTTLYTWVSTFDTEADATGYMGLKQDQMDYMRGLGKTGRVCVSWAHSVWRGAEKACVVSNVDGPLVFAVTEHAREVSKGEAKPEYDNHGKPKVNLEFSQWAPAIARAAGLKIEGECDLIVAVSTDRRPRQEPSYHIDFEGPDTKNRLSGLETDIFRRILAATKDADRMAKAMTEVYTHRKANWLRQYGGPNVGCVVCPCVMCSGTKTA